MHYNKIEVWYCILSRSCLSVLPVMLNIYSSGLLSIQIMDRAHSKYGFNIITHHCVQAFTLWCVIFPFGVCEWARTISDKSYSDIFLFLLWFAPYLWSHDSVSCLWSRWIWYCWDAAWQDGDSERGLEFKFERFIYLIEQSKPFIYVADVFPRGLGIYYDFF